MAKYKAKKQITRSTKVKIDGVQFQSKLESHMYLLLKANNITNGYESTKFTIIDSFISNHCSYEKTPTKKFLHDRGNKKVLPITYLKGWSPDLFVPRNHKDCQEVINIIKEKYY